MQKATHEGKRTRNRKKKGQNSDDSEEEHTDQPTNAKFLILPFPKEFMDDQMSNASYDKYNQKNLGHSLNGSGVDKCKSPSLNPSHESNSGPKFGELPLFGSDMKINFRLD
jgi:hypothetical protein